MLALFVKAGMASQTALSEGGLLGPPAAGAGAQMQILVLFTALALLPALLMSITPFLRIVIVLHFLRQGLGTQGTPSNQVLVGLAMFMTSLLIQPTAIQVYETGWKPYRSGELTAEVAWERGSLPVKQFLSKFAQERDLRLVLEMSHLPAPAKPADLGLNVLAPAYTISELRRGFQIGTMLFLPFLVIDLVVASLTLSVGMVQLPPAMISAPLKIPLFVLVDGWNLVLGSLVKTFQGVI